MKALLVRGQASEGLPRVVANENFTLSVSGSELTAILRDPDLAKGNLWLVWYRLEPTWKSWRALQRLSGPIEDKPKPDGTLTVQRSFLQVPSAPKCLAPGKYRAELYANGSLVATKLVDLAPTQMIRKQFLDLNMQFCMPSGWTVARGGSTDGLMRRFEAPTTSRRPSSSPITGRDPRAFRTPVKTMGSSTARVTATQIRPDQRQGGIDAFRSAGSSLSPPELRRPPFFASGARTKARRTSSSPEATPLKPISCRRCYSRPKPSRTKPAETSSESLTWKPSVRCRVGKL